MSEVINRTTLELKDSVNTPDYPVAQWIINPDLSGVASVPKKYWKIVGDNVEEMTQAEKDVVDAAEAAADKAAKEARVKENITADPLEGLTVDIQVSGLSVTVNINSLVVNDVTTITADPTYEKFLMLCYVYDEGADTLSVNAYEKTTGLYADLTDDEIQVKHLGEWSTPANGTELTEVT